jgi:hypothetical protein
MRYLLQLIYLLQAKAAAPMPMRAPLSTCEYTKIATSDPARVSAG